MSNETSVSHAGFQRVANTGTSLAYMGAVLSFLVNAEETGGGLSILLAHSRQGCEPPPHVHHQEHEVFFVLEGEIEFYVEGVERSMMVRPGGLAFLPRGKAHALAYRTPEVRALAILHALDGATVGAEGFLKKVAVGPATNMELPTMEGYAEIGLEELAAAVTMMTEHGGTFLTPEETAFRLPHYPGFGASPAGV